MAGNEPGYTQPDVSLVGPEHVKRYVETNGEVGYMWNGAPILILTTKGKKSGQPRPQALIYGEDAGKYVIIASYGGAPEHPKWYTNLVADPNVQIQIKGEKFNAKARTAEGAEREKFWNVAAKVWPNYNVYTTRTTRKIPVVILERA